MYKQAQQEQNPKKGMRQAPYSSIVRVLARDGGMESPPSSSTGKTANETLPLTIFAWGPSAAKL